jgi:hypothetical protein
MLDVGGGGGGLAYKAQYHIRRVLEMTVSTSAIYVSNYAENSPSCETNSTLS